MGKQTEKTYSLNRTNLQDQIMNILKEMIADQRFSPKTYINVEELTRELGVSRTPIWEAIGRLEQEGIVVKIPHKGVRVRELTRKTALELYEVRLVLETFATRLAAERITSNVIKQMEQYLAQQITVVEQDGAVAYSQLDHKFHLSIYEASGNALIQEILAGLRYKALPLAFHMTEHFAEFIEFHREIIEALRRHNVEAAGNAMQMHNQRMLDIIKSVKWETEE